MTIEFTNEKATARNDESAGLRDQVFSPAQNISDRGLLPNSDKVNNQTGDSTLNVAGADNLTRAELLERNEALVAEVQKTAERVATTAVKVVQGLPAHLQEAFFDGISCFNDRHDVVYQAMREQWAAVQTA